LDLHKKISIHAPASPFFQGGWLARVAISSKRREPSGQVPGAQQSGTNSQYREGFHFHINTSIIVK